MGKAIWGGLLTGLGSGIVTQAEQMRKEALERAKMLQRTEERKEERNWRKEDMKATQDFQREIQGENRGFQIQRDKERAAREAEEARRRRGHEANLAEIDAMDAEDERRRQRGLFPSATVQTDDGKTIQYNEYGEKRELDGSTKGKSNGISDGEMEAISLFGGDFVERDRVSGKVTGIKDYQGLADRLRRQGQAALADKIAPTSTSIGTAVKRYATPEEVKAALKAGEISSREEAAQILKSDFGFM
jgi:hypothetical protein